MKFLKVVFGLILLLNFFDKEALAQNKMKAPQNQSEKIENTKNQGGFLKFYKSHITQADGDRCAMHPGCAEFSRQAFSTFGFLKAILLTTDRLTRCGKDPMFYPQIKINGIYRSFNPIENLVK